MIKPVKGSELAEQIERARQRIERWPQWLKDAAGVNNNETVEPSPGREPSGSRARWSTADFID